MPVYYNTSTCSNPLAATRTSRFGVRRADSRESAAGHNNTGRHNLNSPACPHPGCHPFTLCMACPPLTCKGYLSPKQLQRKLPYLRNPFTPGRAAA